MAEEKVEYEDTLGLIKPDAFTRSFDIFDRINKEGFTVVEQKQVLLTKKRAEQFYAEHKGKGFFHELVTFMSSGPIFGLQLRKANGIKSWRSLMGPTKHDDAKKQPNCLRALFGTNTTKNACHGSDSTQSAKRELNFFFGTQQTLALIKPDAVEAKNADNITNRIENEGYLIIENQELTLTKERAEKFYEEHKGKGFFNELVNFMISGPIIALKLEGENVIKGWRNLMGPTKHDQAKKEAPNSMRALYGKDTTHNATHGSDSIESAARELNFYFKKEQTFAMIKPDALKNKHENNILQRIVKEQFRVMNLMKKNLTKEEAQNFYIEHKERSFYGELVQYMLSGPVIVLKLERFNAVKKWRDVMGPTFVDEAKEKAPNSIRALYGASKTENATHGSDAVQSANRELKFFFGDVEEQTLALIKPDAVKANNHNKIMARILYEGFYIVETVRLKLDLKLCKSFYSEHNGKGFFNELIEFMSSSDLIALKLERKNGIKKWREIMGPTKKADAVKVPNCIRALYGKDTTHNASHGSDSEDSAKRELEFFFGAKKQINVNKKK